ncbi:hypothetical protein Cni_G25176 [Canna indica]|uniref:1-phosphatidylinositol 4-kinase n=1 Tax=Canna indica TaxID=4628 RepID=A0AAQ3KX60_9LILI|nr:hypothetical protein Cni_G25176 [Canna indica]
MPTDHPASSTPPPPPLMAAAAVDHRPGFRPPSSKRRCRLRSFPHPNPVIFNPEPTAIATGLLLRPTAKFSRSLSTSCLYSANPDAPRRDQIARLEIVAGRRSRTVHALVVEAAIALASGATPVPVADGLSTAHYLFNRFGESFAVVKPMDEEAALPLGTLQGLKLSTQASEMGAREVAAYLLDHAGFAGVPPTALIMITRPSSDSDDADLHPKRIASIQRFVPHDFDAGELGPSRFSVTSVHRIGILDVRILNVDRHAGNILVKTGSGCGCCYDGGCGANDSMAELVPIDHGLCLPEIIDDPYFEWLHWPQASVPFSKAEAEYVSSLDPFSDADLLRADLPLLKDSCLRILIICTIFLKRAVAAGLCLADIGHMMTREFSGFDEEPSEFEALCKRVEHSMKNTTLSPDDSGGYEEESNGEEAAACFQFHMEDGDGFPESRAVDVLDVPSLLQNERLRGRCEEKEAGAEDDDGSDEGSVKEHKIVGKAKSFSFFVADFDHMDGSRSISFEGLSEEEWGLFLERFEKLLPEAFEARKSMALMKQRLGTSCKF